MLKRIHILLFVFILSNCAYSQEFSGLILTEKGLENITSNQGKAPIFEQTLAAIKAEVDAEIERGIDVPVPKDLAGGYTHERHKKNFFLMEKAGTLFAITGNEKYAQYILDMLNDYAELFHKIDRHPARRSYAPGKFFWQCLNDANWLVYTSQAYSYIYNWLDEATRTRLNTTLFRPYADFLSVENPQFFNRIHNHSTWGNAAVGMIGLVMGDDELVNRALFGLDAEVPADLVKDDDGGFILLEGQKEAGFLAQIDHAFSPDGYYTEGPYYQRYAMYPFLIFANALANKKPELGIMEYRDGLLIKAVSALINQTNTKGEFFPINDAQKGMSLKSRELVNAVSMAYYYGKQETSLLSIIEEQGRVPINDAGFAAALAIEQGHATPNILSSIELSDGADGKEGAIGILRSAVKSNNLTLMLKYAKHGMGHGHFDRLSFLLYYGAEEVFQDYGSARWVNIEHKDGGGYLKENNTWAKQTIAHNTVVVNQTTQFLQNVQIAEKHPGTPYLFEVEDKKLQVVSAKETIAYPGVKMHRTMAMIALPEIENELILDLFRIENESASTYELPFYHGGHLMSTSFDYTTADTLTPMGETYGYQHLWTEAHAHIKVPQTKVTWFNGAHFYSLNSVAEPGDEIIFGRIGANDPHFNLRRDPVLIHKRTAAKNTLFANLIEVHGQYNPATEIAVNAFSAVETIKVLVDNHNYTAVQFTLNNSKTYIFCLSNVQAGKDIKHSITAGEARLEWTGPYQLITINN